jgi:hypothetical protein
LFLEGINQRKGDERKKVFIWIITDISNV